MTTCFLGDCTIKSKITKSTKALQCEVCENWFHIKCAKVADNLYEALKEGDNGMHWFCSFCNVGSSKLLKIISLLETELEKCHQTVKTVKQEVMKLKFANDKLEQYTRKDNAIISNITDPHGKDEDMTAKVIELASEIGVTVTREDISTSHRLGSVTATYNRPIIVRFARRDIKRKLMTKRKNLKGNRQYPDCYINDDLTTSRYKITKELRRLGNRVWTQDGKILYKNDEEDDQVSRIDTYDDLCKLDWTEDKMSELGILQ